MTGIRFFSGSRELGQQSLSREILKMEMEKGGKLTNQERFKMIMDRKLKASKKKVGLKNGKPMSLKAERALKEIAAKKAAKEAKAMRQRVIIEKKILQNGLVNRKGKVFDVQGNQIAQINVKNGRMTTMQGAMLGKYKPKSQFVNSILVDAINKHSPYFINLRKMQAMQAAGLDPRTGLPLNQEAMNVHGNSMAAMHGGNYQPMGAMMFNQQNPGSNPNQSVNHFDETPNMFFDGLDGGKGVVASAWGARSNNVWGTMGDNAWGTSSDNVWGSQNSDIWGGVGFVNPFGQKTQNIFGTGNGKNYLKPVGNMIRRLFGRMSKTTVAAFRQSRQGSSGPARSSGTARAPVATPRGPTGGGRR